MGVVTSDFVDALTRNNQAMFEREFLAASAFDGWREIATEIPSDTLTEELDWFGETARMKETTEDDPQGEGLSPFSYSIRNKMWTAMLNVDRNALNDGKLKLIEPRIADLAKEPGRHVGELLLGQFNTNPTAFDGVSWISGSHVWGESGTVNNAINVVAATGTTPTAAEMRTAFNAARLQMRGFTDAKGRIENGVPDTIVYPAIYESIILEALTGSTIGGNGAQPQVATPDQKGIINVGSYKLFCNPFQTSTTKMYFLNTKGTMKPLCWTNREKPTMGGPTGLFHADGTPIRIFKYPIQARYNVGVTHPKYVVEVTFT